MSDNKREKWPERPAPGPAKKDIGKGFVPPSSPKKPPAKPPEPADKK